MEPVCKTDRSHEKVKAKCEEVIRYEGVEAAKEQFDIATVKYVLRKLAVKGP